jgi:hypothetical protein
MDADLAYLLGYQAGLHGRVNKVPACDDGYKDGLAEREELLALPKDAIRISKLWVLQHQTVKDLKGHGIDISDPTSR